MGLANFGGLYTFAVFFAIFRFLPPDNWSRFSSRRERLVCGLGARATDDANGRTRDEFGQDDIRIKRFNFDSFLGLLSYSFNGLVFIEYTKYTFSTTDLLGGGNDE